MTKSYSEIINKPDIPFLKLKGLEVPHEKIACEIDAVINFAKLQGDSRWTKSWKGIALHAIGEDQSRPHTAYGFENEDDAEYQWTSAADACPTLTSFIKKNFYYDKLYRVKVNIMEPGGKIKPHRDSRNSILGYTLPSKPHVKYVTVAIKWPSQVPFYVGKHDIDVQSGDVFLIDFSNTHAVYNKSDEIRYSLIIAMDIDENNEWQKLVCESYNATNIKNYKSMSLSEILYHDINGAFRNFASNLKRLLGKGYS